MSALYLIARASTVKTHVHWVTVSSDSFRHCPPSTPRVCDTRTGGPSARIESAEGGWLSKSSPRSKKSISAMKKRAWKAGGAGIASTMMQCATRKALYAAATVSLALGVSRLTWREHTGEKAANNQA